MKSNLTLSLIFVSIIQISCANLEEKTQTNNDQPSSEEVSSIETEESLNVDSIISTIDEYRASLESELAEAIELTTDSLRAKIKQKWQKIHFYTNNGELQRIKTYPYSEISQRTEEFYIKDGELVLVVIEDQDGEQRGKAKSEIDKLYYFHNGEVVEEMKKDQKAEYSIRESDGEELYTEFKEYVDLFKGLE
jgi:predicted RNase H-like nuclease (RuvC/YqgF family)